MIKTYSATKFNRLTSMLSLVSSLVLFQASIYQMQHTHCHKSNFERRGKLVSINSFQEIAITLMSNTERPKLQCLQDEYLQMAN